jgi:hypothetical protein
VLCAPLVRIDAWGPPIPRLHIPVEVAGAPHLILMTQMESIPATDLGAIVETANARRDAIIGAFGLLVTGF